MATGSILTDKLFTGQREITGLGIYHFNARFYSPKLGRFLSADTIVPGYANPQNLNRFSYTVNNPLRYNDPSGHKVCEGQDNDCKGWMNVPSSPALARQILTRSGVRLSGTWEDRNIIAAASAVVAVGTKFASERGNGESAAEAFNQTFGSTTFEWGCSECSRLARTIDRDTIKFRAFYAAHNDYQQLMNTNLVIHEIGHMFENTIAYDLPDGTEYKPARSSLPTHLANNREGLGTQWIWQQSSGNPPVK